jgi:conjugative transfer signal peptidase TraF
MRGWHHLSRRPWLAPVLLLALTCLHPLGARLNWDTDSQPKGLYWRLPGEPHHGRLILVRLPAEIARFAAERGYRRHPELAKCVAALPGDTVEVTREGLRVNGRLLPGTAPLSRDSAGRPLSRYPRGPHDTLPGWVWLYSNHIPNSWDSRYFGPVPLETVLGSLRPLITWPPFPKTTDGEPTCQWNPTSF